MVRGKGNAKATSPNDPKPNSKRRSDAAANPKEDLFLLRARQYLRYVDFLHAERPDDPNLKHITDEHRRLALAVVGGRYQLGVSNDEQGGNDEEDTDGQEEDEEVWPPNWTSRPRSFPTFVGRYWRDNLNEWARAHPGTLEDEEEEEEEAVRDGDDRLAADNGATVPGYYDSDGFLKESSESDQDHENGEDEEENRVDVNHGHHQRPSKQTAKGKAKAKVNNTKTQTRANKTTASAAAAAAQLPRASVCVPVVVESEDEEEAEEAEAGGLRQPPATKPLRVAARREYNLARHEPHVVEWFEWMHERGRVDGRLIRKALN